MSIKTRFDAGSENFSLFFDHELEKITPEAKDGVPKDVLFKIFRKGGKVNSTSTSKLSFVAKLYILVKCLRKRFYIIVEDEENGIRLKDINNIPKLLKERDYGVENSNELYVNGGFLLGSKEVMDYFAYLNNLSGSPSYNYLLKGKNSVPNPATEEDKNIIAITKFIVNYEGNKKTLVSQTGMRMPEIYVLLYLYRGTEIKSSLLYHEVFKRAYQSSPSKIKQAFGSLQQRGFITKYGDRAYTNIQITPLGKSFIRGILDKYVLNW